MTPRAKPVFNPKTFLTKVGKGKTHTGHSRNQKVFSQGEPADAIFYIQKGKVKLTVVSKQGKEAVIAILGAGDFFGEGCLAGQTMRIVHGHDHHRVLDRADRSGGHGPRAPR
jgi:CRP/FNR family cyclic AMP-dependent transcriptional regulator